jgi:hypothetical protein
LEPLPEIKTTMIAGCWLRSAPVGVLAVGRFT